MARKSWPNQYQWLLEQSLIDWNNHQSWGLSKENIRDKSNADTTVNAFALLQVSWFVAQSIMRAAHDLQLSQLESMTLGYVPLFVVTTLFWWRKPKDVLTPSVVDLPHMDVEQKTTFENMSVDSTFDDEHTKQQDSWWNIWKLTPRVFEKEAKDKASEEMGQSRIPEDNGEDKSKAQNTLETEGPKEVIPAGKAFLRKALIEKISPRRTLTEIKPSFRKAFTEKIRTDESQQSTIQGPDISHESRFLENAFRRVTGLRTTGLTEPSSQKKDSILPQYPSETVVAYWDPQVYHSKI